MLTALCNFKLELGFTVVKLQVSTYTVVPRRKNAKLVERERTEPFWKASTVHSENKSP